MTHIKHEYTSKILLSILILTGIIFLPCISQSAQTTLTWQKPSDTRVSGYNIYCGKTGTEFKLTQHVTIYSPDTTGYTFTDLENGFEYSFAATSFDMDDTESDFSETITYIVGDSGDRADETQTVVFGDTLDADYPGTVVDTFINLNEEINYSGDQLNTYTWPENMPANTILFQFDLSQIPVGVQIQSATLSLYQTAAGGDATYDVAVHKIINHNPDLYQATGYTFDGVNEWTVNNACYNNIPLAQADIAPAADVKNLELNSGYKGWNVTSMVQEWVSDSSTNYGLLLNSDTVAAQNSYRFFAASEALNASQRPVLEVVYTSSTSPSAIDDNGDGYTENKGDRNDIDATIHPGAIEICGGGIDQDCNGSDLKCIPEEDKQAFVMETGEVEINHKWQFVPFAKIFINPVVVAKPMSLKGWHPAVIRINNVTLNGFEIRIQEWEYLDGKHVHETVGYMVMEAGRYELPGGVNVEAGTFEVKSRKTIRFDKTFNRVPVVISGVTTENDFDTVTGRISNISLYAFDIELQEQEKNIYNHEAYETLSYIAWESSSGIVNGVNYIVDSTFNEVKHNLYYLPFYPAFTSTPVFVADMQTENGGDTANVRWQHKDANGVEVQIDEERSNDFEVEHVFEIIGYMVFAVAP